MEILIVEDETVAYENLVNILTEIDPAIMVVGNTESVNQTIQWLQSNPSPDLILMDIRLSDGSAFTIFKTIRVNTPIIFTTAFDEYAIEAFKVNSIDYLLKPIKTNELKRALAKFARQTHSEIVQYLERVSRLEPAVRYRDRLLVPIKDKLIPINLRDVSCFYTTEKHTVIYLRDGSIYPYSKTLEQILSSLNPVDFMRANKQFILSRDSVQNITIWFDNRLLITLSIEPPERVYISKNKAAEFKTWLTKK
ncbi:MAG: LytTR family DNA-binding domain-containing protein [Tannerella sp.]|jgi:DNA-binding LytR/AlgR family response regulator|nr:LytTR family DNA-binding domain-containing protein [Tannerella sp.]